MSLSRSSLGSVLGMMGLSTKTKGQSLQQGRWGGHRCFVLQRDRLSIQGHRPSSMIGSWIERIVKGQRSPLISLDKTIGSGAAVFVQSTVRNFGPPDPIGGPDKHPVPETGRASLGIDRQDHDVLLGSCSKTAVETNGLIPPRRGKRFFGWASKCVKKLQGLIPGSLLEGLKIL